MIYLKNSTWKFGFGKTVSLEMLEADRFISGSVGRSLKIIAIAKTEQELRTKLLNELEVGIHHFEIHIDDAHNKNLKALAFNQQLLANLKGEPTP